MKSMLNTQKKKIAAVAAGILLVIGIAAVATTSAGASNTTRGIGLEKSIAVALADAGLKQEQVSNLQGHFDKEDGIDAYEVSFNANGYEYEYSIKAADGAVLECQIESPDGEKVTVDEALDIGQDKALAAALGHAGLKKSDVEITKSKKDRDDGVLVYEFEFRTSKAEYEYDIDATTGGVRAFSKEVIKSSQSVGTNGPNNSSSNSNSSSSGSSSSGNNGSSSNSSNNAASSSYIGVDKAKSIALGDAGLKSSSVTFTTAKLDRDDGRYIYEIDFYTSQKEYDYEIDATSGKILDRDVEKLDDDDWDDDDDDDDDDDRDDDDDDDRDDD